MKKKMVIKKSTVYFTILVFIGLLSLSAVWCRSYEIEIDNLNNDLLNLESKYELQSSELIEINNNYTQSLETIEGLENRNRYLEYKETWYRRVDFKDEYQFFMHEICRWIELDYDEMLDIMFEKTEFNTEFVFNDTDEFGNVLETYYGVGKIALSDFELASELCGRELDLINNVYDNIEASLRIYKYRIVE